ncbi:uncharacterized protein I303_107222 [Kwoniella dejecticola CBS 10117]|uniref:Uncharacterized protein n=1 Tax=Kwoniella dejecticola CBS 10117 TaxID=1296121 RepID=A0A1A5ZZ30_9TREE|nr:uncharacterized protein I303_06623 [Kwoniella dejecticola CBS 10117]OBR83064.1 hypothetical protein I303_06623 [Kwoniella dejecticola CBS 10117]
MSDPSTRSGWSSTRSARDAAQSLRERNEQAKRLAAVRERAAELKSMSDAINQTDNKIGSIAYQMDQCSSMINRADDERWKWQHQYNELEKKRRKILSIISRDTNACDTRQQGVTATLREYLGSFWYGQPSAESASSSAVPIDYPEYQKEIERRMVPVRNGLSSAQETCDKLNAEWDQLWKSKEELETQNRTLTDEYAAMSRQRTDVE